jgi:hypothetical protein
LAQPTQAPSQQRDPPAGQPAVTLELGLARTARPDPAAEALEVLPHAPHARQVVLQLSQLDLQLALCTHGVLGEDVENQLRAVDDTRLEHVLERTLLHRAELAVDEQHVGARFGIDLLQLGELALADVAAGIRARPVLGQRRDRLDARGARKLLQLGQLLLRDGALGQHSEDEPALGLGARRRIGLVCRHAWIMPACSEVSILRTASLSRSSGTVSEIRK